MLPNVFLLTVFLASLLINISSSSNEFNKLKFEHRPQELNENHLQRLSELSNATHIDEVLDNILIPRVVGTPNHEKVFKYIVGQLRALNWDVRVDEFKDKTPNFGQLTFKNIIATLNLQAERYLVLACHYDSKYFENEIFLGAIDSAVPCAMMLNLAFVMRRQLENIKNRRDVSLKLVFFDGEEAFVNWGPNDSIYGAKHLANSLQQTKSTSKITGESVSDLDRIDVLVLLDLIGARDPHFYSFFRNTEKWYTKLADAERDLGALGLLKDHPRTYFKRRSSHSYVEDDHIPFLVKNVPILHLIPTPFPKTWHTTRDDRGSVDLNVVENINKILRIFVAQYLHLTDGAMPTNSPTPTNFYPLPWQPIYYNWIVYYL